MLKTVPPGSQLFNEPVVRQIKRSSRGLIGDDYTQLVKRAGDEAAHKFEKLSFHPGEIPIHLIALGSTESIGPNRNGDGFKEANCRVFHDTFVKYARMYRLHANKDPKKSYGIVKASWFNEPMSRIELIVALNGTKEAADRNGGLVADKEIEKLQKGDDIPVSMSCSVGFDKCSGCGNKAKTRKEYCDEKRCVKYGGLKNNIAKVFEDGHILHADNPEPSFFDISSVIKPADRIAYVLGKFASAESVGGASLAEELGLTAPLEILALGRPSRVSEQLKTLDKLASVENSYSVHKDDLYGMSYDGSVFDGVEMPKVCSSRMYGMLKALSMEKIALSVYDFFKLLGVREEVLEKTAETVTSTLPGVYGRLANHHDLLDLVEKNPFSTGNLKCSEADRRWARSISDRFSMQKEHLQKRAWLQIVRGKSPILLTKGASACKNNISEAELFLAEQYALYKVAFLSDLNEADGDFELTANLLVCHNYTS